MMIYIHRFPARPSGDLSVLGPFDSKPFVLRAWLCPIFCARWFKTNVYTLDEKCHKYCRLIKLAFNGRERMQTTSKVRKQTISDGYLRANVPTLNSGPADSKGTCWTKYFWRNRSGSFSLSSKLSVKGILRLAVVYKNKIIASFNFSCPWLHLLFFFFLINISFKDIFFTDQFGREREYILSTEVESGHCMAKLYWLHVKVREPI